MSYYIHEKTIKSSLKIEKSNEIELFKNLKDYLLQQNQKKDFERINIEELESSTNLDELIDSMRWKLVRDENQNIISIKNDGISVAEENLLFIALFGYVLKGSFVEYEREGYLGKIKEIFKYMEKYVSHTTFLEDYDFNGESYWRNISTKQHKQILK